MAACEFPITFHQDLDELLDRFTQAVQVKGGSFSRDGRAGRFSIPSPEGPVEGLYTVAGNTFHFEITTQPAAITCHRIDNSFRSLIGSPPDTSLDFGLAEEE
ncbi:hypothetical protein [Lewinella sp. IMCC34183]|uniref:hypothetical protein n=1 Tax=Lewinella sp. IMCC34183 TaxID=2248762 RepID=UPI000E21F1FF|nr:hypothetical protein [Lewinella sp. IMCC34183]